MKSHPLAERYPLMEDAEFETFKADVKANGCREPIRRFGGLILDGRNRHRACVELGITPPFEDFEGTEDEAAAAVDSWNLHRRHLTAEFRRQRVIEMRAKGMSLRKIAAELGIHNKTVERDLAAGAAIAAPAQPEQRPHERQAQAPQPPAATQSSPARAEAPAPAPGHQESSPRPEQRPAPVAPPKVTGRDGKQYAATRPQAKPTAEPAPPPARKAKAVAIVVVQDAIERLRTIPIDDPERVMAWKMMARFLRSNP